MKTVIIHGPQGCGKTYHSQQFAKAFGCTSIVDGWMPELDPVTPGALHLTFHPEPQSVRQPNSLPHGVMTLSFNAACVLANINPSR